MKSLRINLYVKADKKSMNDLVPIYVKIIYLGSKTTYNTGLKANHQRWTKTLQLTRSKLPTEIAIREQLDTLIHDLRQICEKLESKNMPFGAQTIKQVYVNNDDLLLGGDIMLSELFDKHHQTFEPLVESGVRAQETLRKYETLRNHVYDFIDDEFKLHDIPLKNLNYSFIESFDLYLRKDKGIGNNTTVKYVQTFKSLMNVAVKYDWLLKDPFIMYDKKVKVKDAVKIRSGLNSLEQAKSVVQTEQTPKLTGGELIPEIIQSLNENRIIQFEYRKFNDSSETKLVKLEPHLLKEDRHRWYVLGRLEKFSEPTTTYALDRMTNVELLEDRFEPIDFDFEEYFKYSFGITVTNDEPIEVVLSFTPTQGKYLKTLKIHPTQSELIDDENEYRISLKVKPSWEFYEKILGYGNNVRILSPGSVIQSFKERIQLMSESYS